MPGRLVQGHVSRGFEAVREAFTENFARRRELGGACCAYYGGEKVVDLWGGIRNKQTREPWERDTMVIVYSATKGLAAMTLAIAHSRGWLDYEERVCAYWPEFAQHGKDRVTVRQLLAHQAGLFAIDEPVDRSLIADLDRLAIVLARQKPAWKPGTRQAYHGITLGYYESELLRRVDPQHRSLGQFFQDEIASRLGLDVYIRLPETIPNSRLATISRPGWITWKTSSILRGFPVRLALEALNRRSNISGRSSAPIFPTTINASMRATSKCRPAGPSGPHERSRRPTASSPWADASWDCSQRHWSSWPRRLFRRRAGSTTNA
jgi:CubicO group peptidase (beta-lactamase class C family)